MPMFSKRPASLAHLSDEAAARALSKHFGSIVDAARDLNIDRKALSRLVWSNPAILAAAHDRMAAFVEHVWGEAVSGLDDRRASVRQRAVDKMFAHPRMIGHPLAGASALLTPARRGRAPSAGPTEAERARAALEREVAAERDVERAAEREREAAAERALEQERVEVMVERRPVSPVAPAMSLWPPGIHRPTRGQRWRR
jgi:hypothetical protein